MLMRNKGIVSVLMKGHVNSNVSSSIYIMKVITFYTFTVLTIMERLVKKKNEEGGIKKKTNEEIYCIFPIIYYSFLCYWHVGYISPGDNSL